MRYSQTERCLIFIVPYDLMSPGCSGELKNNHLKWRSIIMNLKFNIGALIVKSEKKNVDFQVSDISVKIRSIIVKI